jgi:hypothetical protein
MMQSKGATYYKKLACVKSKIPIRGMRLRAPIAYHMVEFVPTEIAGEDDEVRHLEYSSAIILLRR